MERKVSITQRKTVKSRKQIVGTVMSSLVGELGSNVLSFGLSFMLLDKTGSVFSFALSNIISPVAGLILLPIVGPIVDRFSKKKIICISQLVTLTALLGYWFLLSIIPAQLLPLTIGLIVVLRSCDQFTSTTRQAAAGQLVLADDLQRLSSFTQMSATTVTVLSSVFGGALYGLLPFTVFLLVDGVAEIVTLLLTLLLDFNFNCVRYSEADRNKERPEKNFSNWRLFTEGLRYILRQKYLIFGMGIATSINFISGIFSVGLPVIVLQALHGDTFQYGMLQGLNSIGFLVGGILLQKWIIIRQPIWRIWQFAMAVGLLLLGIGCTTLLGGQLAEILLGLLMFGTGFCFALLNVPYVAWLQNQLPMSLQGRVFSVLGTLGLATTPLGVLLYGWLLQIKFSSLTVWTGLIFICSGFILMGLLWGWRKVFGLSLKEAVILSEK